jgi:hemerythrin-like domain-containing protein
MTAPVDSRRRFLMAAGLAGAAPFGTADAETVLTLQKQPVQKPGEKARIGAAEHLMREHGVIRRVLLVYRQSAGRLRSNPANVDPQPIVDAAKLFRAFGEDFHQKEIEETLIFPALRKVGGPAADHVDVLVAQHDRGRSITDYILETAGKGTIGSGDVEPLQRAFIGIDLMFANHTAREDTIVIPAWRAALSGPRLSEIGRKIEEVRRARFGKLGFAEAVAEIGRIEQSMGFADLAEFTVPAPSKI